MSDSERTAEPLGKQRFALSEIKDLPISIRAMGFGALAILTLIFFVYPAYPTVVGKSLAG